MSVAYTIPADTKGRGSPFHDNVGRTVIYNTSSEPMGAKPAVVLAQSGPLADLAVFTYDYQTVTVLGAVIGQPAGQTVRPAGKHLLASRARMTVSPVTVWRILAVVLIAEVAIYCVWSLR